MIALDTNTFLSVNPTSPAGLRRASRHCSSAPRRALPTPSAVTSSETVVTWSGPSEPVGMTTVAEGHHRMIRWYDPVTGRWLSKDLIGISGGLNQYVAFNNNPVNFRDPDGRAAQAVALYVLRKGLIGGGLGALSGGISGLFDSPTGNLSLKNAGKGAVTGFVGGFVAGAASTVPVFGDIGGGAAGGWVSAALYSKWQGIPLSSDRGKSALAFGTVIGAGGGIIDSFYELPLLSPLAAGFAGGGYNLVDNLLQNVQDFTDGVIEDRERQYEEICP